MRLTLTLLGLEVTDKEANNEPDKIAYPEANNNGEMYESEIYQVDYFRTRGKLLMLLNHSLRQRNRRARQLKHLARVQQRLDCIYWIYEVN
jgi:hypothetical protein